MAGQRAVLVAMAMLAACSGPPAVARNGAPAPIQGSEPPAVIEHPFSVGGMHACARTRDARVMCWGLNEFGQLGDGTREDRSAPVLVPGVGDVAGVAAGRQHTCIWTRRGDAVCWGGYGSAEPANILPTPHPVVGLSNVVEIVAGGDRDCARLRDGRVTCFNFWSWSGLQRPPLEIPEARDATLIAVGQFLVCARLAGGKVGCWGGSVGPFEDLSRTATYAKVSELPGAEGVIGLVVDRTTVDNFLGWQPSGAFVAWRSEVGSPPTVEPAPALPRFRAVAMGHEVGCGLDDRGVSCWTHADRSHGAPALIDGTQGAVQLDVGSSSPYDGQNTACASFADGTLACWGRSSQVGAGLSDVSVRAVAVPGITDAVELAANSEGHHACVRHATGRVSCWGGLNETFWTVGDPEVWWTTPRDAGLDGATSLVAGPGGVCAVRRGKPWSCAGQKPSTMQPPGVGHTVGDFELCNISASGDVTCIPSDPDDVPHEKEEDDRTVPTQVGKLTRLWLDGDDGCAVRRDGKLACWYRNMVQNTDTYQKRFTEIVADDAIDVALGDSASCFVRKTGRVSCLAHTVPFGRPDDVEGIAGAIAITAGFGGFCALLRDGHVKCWSETFRVGGEPSRNGTFTKLVTIEDLDDATALHGAEWHVCALRQAGRVACWGRREFLGTGASSLTGPTKVLGVQL